MNFFYVMNGKTIKQLMLVVVAAFFTAWFLFLESYVHIPTFSENNDPKAIYKGEKDVALTFNIGWGDEKAEPILDILAKKKVSTATFFLAGSWAERHPDIVERIVKDGYEIGILGYNYEDYKDLEEKEIRKDLARALEAFSKLNVKDIKLARAPTGHFDQETLKVADRLGLTIVHWSLNSEDWKNPGVEVILENVSKAKKGDIILLHASDSAKQTAVALPNIIDTLNKKGLKFVSVSEMIANADAKTKEIK
jgi:peptidoglycan-N-acetylglucosamine deacetylase